MPIQHVKGDIFATDANFILHQVNCRGVMGGGVALQVRQKYPEVFAAYHNFCEEHRTNPAEMLGHAQLCRIEDDRYIINLFAQKDFGYDGRCYTDYDALRTALHRVGVHARQLGMSIAIPYLMACHRGGGDWTVVSGIIEEELGDCDVTLYEYTAG